MSNVHQLVNELATYEQQRKQLEIDLDNLRVKFDNDNDTAVSNGAILSEEYINNYNSEVEALEATLDNVWLKIDNLNEDIDEESYANSGYLED